MGQNNANTEITMEEKYAKSEKLRKAVNCLVTNREKANMFKKLAKEYKALGEYKDSKKQYEECVKEQKRYEGLAAEEVQLKKEQNEKKETEEETTGKKGKMALWLIAVLLVIALIGGIYFKTEPGRYARAAYYEKTENFVKSYKMFTNLKNYKDSKERSTESHYKYAVWCIENKKYDTAISKLRQLEDYKDSEKLLADAEICKIKESKIGGDVLFGEAHWIILDKSDTEVFLGKSKPIQIEDVAYNTVSKDVTWEESSLRKYLNEQFTDEIFNNYMLEKIITKEIVVPDNKEFHTKGCTTEDKLFLLNAKQAEKYSDLLDNYLRDWWLINPGCSQSTAQFVSYGKIMESGYDVSSTNIFIRPAMWVSLED